MAAQAAVELPPDSETMTAPSMLVSVATPSSSSRPSSSRYHHPSSSAIATTTLESLPKHHLAEADELLGGGAEKLDPWLKDALVQLALYRQGTCAEDVRTVASAHWRKDAVCVVEQRYARQLLAQVSWEMELCTESMQGPTPSALAVPQPNHIAKQAPVSPRGLSAKRSERPVSAGVSRWRESRERGLQLAEVRSQHKRCQWDEKERALAGVRQLREQRLDEARQRARQRNRQVEEHREAALQSHIRQQEDLSNMLAESGRLEDERLAELRVRERESAIALGSAQASRMAAQEANRRRILEERKRQQQEQLKRSEQAIAEAQQRRAKMLRARSTGSSSLRTNRELAVKRVARTARIKEVEREALRQRLENPQPKPPILQQMPKTVVTVPCTSSTSASGAGICTDDEPESEASAQQECDRPVPDRVPWPRVVQDRVPLPRFPAHGFSAAALDARPTLRPVFNRSAGGAAEIPNSGTVVEELPPQVMTSLS